MQGWKPIAAVVLHSKIIFRHCALVFLIPLHTCYGASDVCHMKMCLSTAGPLRLLHTARGHPTLLNEYCVACSRKLYWWTPLIAVQSITCVHELLVQSHSLVGVPVAVAAAFAAVVCCERAFDGHWFPSSASFSIECTVFCNKAYAGEQALTCRCPWWRCQRIWPWRRLPAARAPSSWPWDPSSQPQACCATCAPP